MKNLPIPRLPLARLARIGLAGASLLALSVAAPMGAALAQTDAADIAFAGDAVAVTGAAADQAVASANAYLNGLQALQGRFQQINPDGSVAEGDFFLQRPGRLRFAYDAPSPLVIVADGRTVAQIDSDLETVDRVTLEETPLNYLLKANVDLAGDGQVQGVARQGDLVMISLDDPRDRIPGQLILLFSDPEFALREWVAIDAYNQQTRVVLFDVRRVAQLDPGLFTYEAIGSRRPGQR